MKRQVQKQVVNLVRKSEGTGRGSVLPFIEGLVDARHFTFFEVLYHLADEELETVEVTISNNIPYREFQNWEFSSSNCLILSLYQGTKLGQV